MQRKAGAAGWERQAGRQESTSHTMHSKLRERFGCRAKARRHRLRVLGSCFQGNGTLFMFLVNKENCTKDKLCPLSITYQHNPCTPELVAQVWS